MWCETSIAVTPAAAAHATAIAISRALATPKYKLVAMTKTAPIHPDREPANHKPPRIKARTKTRNLSPRIAQIAAAIAIRSWKAKKL
jgi:hypothetical protein